MLVTRSEHWNATRYVKKNTKKEIGIITEKRFYQDKRGRVVCWPSVHWEGGIMSSLVHPALIAPYRKNQRLPEMEIEE